jgi:hypothetical protein
MNSYNAQVRSVSHLYGIPRQLLFFLSEEIETAIGSPAIGTDFAAASLSIVQKQ